MQSPMTANWTDRISVVARAPLPARLLAILVLVAALATAALAFRPAAHVFDTPLTEDAYYSLAVARNIGAGRGITIDGTQPTNGFQPLFTFLEAGAYKIAGGNEVMALRLVTGLSWAIWLGTGLLLGLVARDLVAHDGARGTDAERQTRRWLATALYCCGFLTFMHHFNGLETGLLMLGYVLLWRCHQRRLIERRWGPVLFGLLIGLLVLTRIDAAIFAVLFGLWRLWRDRVLGLPRALGRAVLMGGIALLVSAPWWLFNYLEFGALMPTSGTAQTEWAVEWGRMRWMIWALGASAMPTLWVGRFDEIFYEGLIPSLIRGILAILVLWGLWRAMRRGTARDLDRPTLEFGGVLLAAIGLLALYYTFGFIAHWFYYRYLFFFSLPAVVAIAWLLAPRLVARPALALLAVLVALPMLASAIMARQGRTLHVQTVYWDQIALIDEQVPQDEDVAAGQAGTLGYFRAHTVNVDGKVNRRVLDRQDDMWIYLDETGVRWFCDWPAYVDKYLGPDPVAHGWRLAGQKGEWQLWRRNQ